MISLRSKNVAISILAASLAACGGVDNTNGSKDLKSNFNGNASKISSLPSSDSPTLITSAIQVSHNSLPAPSNISSKYLDRTYCSTKEDAMVVIAHADDDRYFMADKVRNELAAGNCIKILQINAGFDVKPPSDANEYNVNDPYYYQGRIDGAVATYAKLLSNNFTSGIYLTNSWDTIDGQLINRFILSKSLNGSNPSGQTIEIQVLGLPNSSNASPTSGAGNVTSKLYSDNNASSVNVASYITGYNISNNYNWSKVQGIVNQIFSWLNPRRVYSLDPFGIPNDDGKEGQHPDHIMAARLVYFSNFAKNNPNAVNYYKTYNVNTFEPNLTQSVAAATESDLQEHWRFDWGSSFLTNSPCDISSFQSSSSQFTPYSWACKNYKATPDEYFVAKTIKDSNGFCLNASSQADLSFGSCGVQSLQITIGKANLAWVSNNSTVTTGASKKLVLYPRSLSKGANIDLIDFTSASSSTRWHFNDSTNKIEFIYTDSSGNIVKNCLSKNSSNKAILESCSTAISLNPSNTERVSAGNIKLKNALTGTCLGLSSTGVEMVNCVDAKSSLKISADNRVSNSDGSFCLNSPTFASTGALTARACSQTSPGQQFDIQKISGTQRVVIRPYMDHMCLENDLNIWACHAYEQQNWIIN